MLTRAKEIRGYSLRSLDGELGSIKEFFFDDNHWIIRYLVAETGSWLKERKVLVSPYSLGAINGEEKYISVELTKKQIEDSPLLETDKPVSKQFEELYYGYYGWPVYWNGMYAWGSYPVIFRNKKPDVTPERTNIGGKSWDPNLRSSSDVMGYSIMAIDGEIGRVKDYIIDDETWEIIYFLVDTRNWIQGKLVLISPKWIDVINCEESSVVIDLSREAIKNSPEFSEDDIITRDYETTLHGHYNKVGHWVSINE